MNSSPPPARPQTGTVVAIRVVSLFLLPDLLLPRMGANGWFDPGHPLCWSSTASRSSPPRIRTFCRTERRFAAVARDPGALAANNPRDVHLLARREAIGEHAREVTVCVAPAPQARAVLLDRLRARNTHATA